MKKTYQCTLDDLYKFNKEKNNINKFKVKTRFGYHKINSIEITAKNSEILKVIDYDNNFIECSPDHKILTENNIWKKSKDLKINDTIFNNNGKTYIKNIEKLEFKEDLYDIEVNEVHEYYANNIVVHNSVAMDAIYFALTGDPYRSINKPKLVNNINNKNCLVELEFISNNINYIIKRGIKPNKFEIWKNGEIIPEDGKRVTFYQDKLNKITGLTPQLIRNLILISSSLKTYFSLSKNDKRNFNDDIFNLKQFNKMLEKQKIKLNEISNSISQKENDLIILNKTLEQQNKQLEQYYNITNKIKAQKSKDKQKIKKEISEYKIKLKDNTKNYNIKSKEYNKIKEENERNKKKLNFFNDLNNKLSELNNSLHMYESQIIDETCPTCKQRLPKDKRKELINNHRLKVNNIKTEIKETEKELKKYSNIDIKIIDISDYEKECKVLENDIHLSKNMIEKLLKDIESFNVELPEKPNINIKETKSKIENLEKDISKQKEILKYLKITNKILLDGNLKSYIISNYLPFINEQINYYLEMFNFDLKIRFNSDLEFQILSRKYLGYEFNNFSVGQKMRLNLALMFTIIQLNKLINFGTLNLVSNILFIDEFFDAGMDSDGIIDCLNLILQKNKKENVSIFIISHKVDAENTDFKIIEANQVNEFCRLKEI
jgi:DNA repair exonuclease SbcCD ATPase subunit